MLLSIWIFISEKVKKNHNIKYIFQSWIIRNVKVKLKKNKSYFPMIIKYGDLLQTKILTWQNTPSNSLSNRKIQQVTRINQRVKNYFIINIQYIFNEFLSKLIKIYNFFLKDYSGIKHHNPLINQLVKMIPSLKMRDIKCKQNWCGYIFHTVPFKILKSVKKHEQNDNVN